MFILTHYDNKITKLSWLNSEDHVVTEPKFMWQNSRVIKSIILSNGDIFMLENDTM